MDYKILFVDDDTLLLNSIRRNLAGEFPLVTVESGQLALEFMEKEFCPIIISDMRMPGMDGVQFLSAVRKKNPDSVRVMLTGNADLGTAVSAVNEGQIFRFLLKPCPVDVIKTTLESCIRQYELVTAEKELLEKTLLGSIRAMTDLLSVANPLAYAHSSRVTQIVKIMLKRLQPIDGWATEIASLLGPIGLFTVPEDIMVKLRKGDFLNTDEKRIVAGSMKTGCESINRIPRMQNISNVIMYQLKNFDGSGYPEDHLSGTEIPLGARILRIAVDFEFYCSKGLVVRLAMETMKKHLGAYDPYILDLLGSMIEQQGEKKKIITISVFEDLKYNMTFENHLLLKDGAILIHKDQRYSPFFKLKIENGSLVDKIQWPASVTIVED